MRIQDIEIIVSAQAFEKRQEASREEPGVEKTTLRRIEPARIEDLDIPILPRVGNGGRPLSTRAVVDHGHRGNNLDGEEIGDVLQAGFDEPPEVLFTRPWIYSTNTENLGAIHQNTP